MTARPPWLRAKAPGGPRTAGLLELTQRSALNTVCQSAHCPNLGECWGRGTATFLLLGARCTRNCRFCAVEPGAPLPPDPAEPRRVAEAVAALGLRHAVLTSVTRDDLVDGGAAHLAAAIAEIRRLVPTCAVEVLTPDFQGKWAALEAVLAAGPEVFAHNLETVGRLYPAVRPQADYGRSLGVLARAAALRGGKAVKSGLMVGLGETWDEMLTALGDLRQAGASMLTVGQYLSPSPAHHPIARYWRPAEFQQLALIAHRLGFEAVMAAPLVRSSYHAEAMGA